MTTIKLKNIDRFKDRHGKVRYYYRPGRGVRVPLRGAPGSPEFMTGYEQAARGEPVAAERKQRGDAGTFDRLVQDCFTSPEYLRLTPSTQNTDRGMIERLLIEENIGHRLVGEMRRAHVRLMMAKRVATPGASNGAMKVLKILIHLAIETGLRRDDPTLRIKTFVEGKHHTWTEQEIAQFEQHWPIGTTARLAFALLLFTGQRRSDVVRMSPADVQEETIGVVPQKTKRSNRAMLWIPVHPALGAVLATTRTDGEAILLSSLGRPFTGNGFGNYMADKIERAGLPERWVTHGLRKAAARRLAEAGCSANEIAAITGHATLAEVSRYTKAAEQRKLGTAAMERLAGTRTTTASQTGLKGLGSAVKNVDVSRHLEVGSQAPWV